MVKPDVAKLRGEVREHRCENGGKGEIANLIKCVVVRDVDGEILADLFQSLFGFGRCRGWRVVCAERPLLFGLNGLCGCLLYTSPSPRDQRGSRMPSSA